MPTDVWFWAFCGLATVVACAAAYHLGLGAGFRGGHNVGFREGWEACDRHNRPRAKLTAINGKEQR